MCHPWAVTVAATAISTHALDTVATAAGVLLVASHALDGLEQWHALVLLAVTDAAWGASLSANARHAPSPQEGGSTMIRITRRRSVGTLAVIAGLLAAAPPAGAQAGEADRPSVITMIDYEGAAVRAITYNGHAGLGSAHPK